MPFVKGNPGKPKGALNKDKRLVRDIVEQALGMSAPQKLLELCKGKPDKLIEVLMNLMPFMYARLATKEVSSSEEQEGADPVLVAKIIDLLRRSSKPFVHDPDKDSE
jgi:hypothetical protein